MDGFYGDIIINNDILNDYENELCKEMYAHFGLAVYLAQCIEHSLVNGLCYFDLLPNKKPEDTTETYDLYADKHFSTTMGVLIKNFTKSHSLTQELMDLLNETKIKRNFLVHDYFRERAVELGSSEGLNKIINELQEIQLLFTTMDSKLDELINWDDFIQ